MSRREAGKQERRARILQAAEDLIRSDEVAFSMRALAERADVAFVTPFNLFENKAGVLLSLIDKRIDAQIQRLSPRNPAEDPIDRLLQQAVVGSRAYTSDPLLYRPLLRAISTADTFQHVKLTARSVELWMLALRDADESGLLRQDHDRLQLAQSLHIGFRSALWQWAMEWLDDTQLEVHCQLGVGVSLLTAVSEEGRALVVDRVAYIAETPTEASPPTR